MKKDTYYFSHDYNAASDYKILYLRQQLGMEGYGIFWYLIEQLAQAGGKLPIKIIPVLAMQMQVTEAKVAAVINSFELFSICNDEFESDRLNRHLTERNSFSEFGKKGALTRWKNRGAIRGAINPANAKESKGKERKVFIAPTLDEVKLYFKENGYTQQSAIKAFSYYDVAKWHDSKGSPIKNWKQKMQGVWFKDENKDTTEKPIEQMTIEEIREMKNKQFRL